MRGYRLRVSRWVPRILRQTVGATYAAAEHRDPIGPQPPELGADGVVQLDYDDGNGCWVSNGVSD